MTNKTGFSHHKNQKKRKGEGKKLDQIFIFFSSFVSVSHETRAPPNIATSESLRSREVLCNYWEMDDKKMSSFIESVQTILSIVKSASCSIRILRLDNNFKAVLQNPDLMHFSYVVLIAIWRPIQVWLKSLLFHCLICAMVLKFKFSAQEHISKG